MVWLNDLLDEVWVGRGPYPGIGSILMKLGFPYGVAFQRLVLSDLVRKNENPLDYVMAILEDRTKPPEQYSGSFDRAQLTWRGFGRNPIRQDLLKTLARFELTYEQVQRIVDPDERKAAGIGASDDDLVNNPYLLSELDLGSAKSEAISLDVIDRGMVPEGNAALFIDQKKKFVQDDNRRVRAVAVDVLKEAADCGDTVFTVPDLLEKVRNRFPENRACRPDREFFVAEAEYHQKRLWLALENEPPLAALKYLRSLEEAIVQTIQHRVAKTNPAPVPPIDWKAALVEKFGDPKNDREFAALTEKVKALDTLFTRRVSVLTGSAGTGKPL